MEHEYFKNALDLFLFGLGVLIIAIILNTPFKKKKVKQNLSFGLEQKDKLEYINDGLRIINTTRLKSIYLFATVFIIASIIYLILGIIEYF
ncbi:hypothetical protein [Empedobacter tilapiae]|uniref:Uncharacterized protein n=1 Tax=Empedobacter tilapiae TaxID=2491114 RepID=A0A4Z1BGG9_9FLAO|nr:hypothetical protein [Empedobacter tilapiae]TGN29288.1 hypothetical protein E4J94_04880 [Empedobacter tilapiae]